MTPTFEEFIAAKQDEMDALARRYYAFRTGESVVEGELCSMDYVVEVAGLMEQYVHDRQGEVA